MSTTLHKAYRSQEDSLTLDGASVARSPFWGAEDTQKRTECQRKKSPIGIKDTYSNVVLSYICYQLWNPTFK